MRRAIAVRSKVIRLEAELMGLSIDVGILAHWIEEEYDSEGVEYFRKEIASMNEVLLERGLPQHEEPEHLPELKMRNSFSGFSYGDLHYLRRFYANVKQDPDWIPIPMPEGEDPTEDDALDDEKDYFESHLIFHSDCGGYYFPIDFEEPLLVPGDFLCSSYRLLEELVTVAPALGIELDGNNLSDSEAAKVDRNADPDSGDKFWREKTVWLCLFEAARISIEYKTAICFT
jgi:hypothetical protein